ncbi:hypothetical protein PRZ48_005693 [Zasmidium cellare]|uniref:Uncharacterized protein n=1 Tax=Zasmidium cellare TaxID=395010 RepID=A0ABR0EN75_ZASCE|nr:hypothetical protein PRZ48_005693 [Zasmidium cellare]
MGATSAASGTKPIIVVSVVLGLALIFIAICIGLYSYLEKRKARAIQQDIEAQQKRSAWHELALSKVWPASVTRKLTGTPRDGELSIVIVDSSSQPHAAVPAIEPQARPSRPRMQTIAE